MRKRKLYPTDLMDKQWAILAPLIPVAKTGGRPHQVNLRQVLNAIFYIQYGQIHVVSTVGKGSSLQIELR